MGAFAAAFRCLHLQTRTAGDSKPAAFLQQLGLVESDFAVQQHPTDFPQQPAEVIEQLADMKLGATLAWNNANASNQASVSLIRAIFANIFRKTSPSNHGLQYNDS